MKNAIAIAIIIILGAILMNIGYDRSMVVHCNKLKAQSVEYKSQGFFISQIDHDECANVYNIEIDAPVKGNE